MTCALRRLSSSLSGRSSGHRICRYQPPRLLGERGLRALMIRSDRRRACIEAQDWLGVTLYPDMNTFSTDSYTLLRQEQLPMAGKVLSRRAQRHQV
jgi:hypothetical protein